MKFRIECSYKPGLGEFVCPAPPGMPAGAFIAKRRVKGTKDSDGNYCYFVYCDVVRTADLTEADQRKWANHVYWNDIVGPRAFIPGTKEWKAREISNLEH